MTIIHELIHGYFFYKFTGEKPKFGFKKLSAYAGAPNWYLKKKFYLIACLSPFIILTFAGLTALLFVPSYSTSLMLIVVSAHAAGCVGDIWVALLLINKPSETYIYDNGMVIKIGNVFKL